MQLSQKLVLGMALLLPVLLVVVGGPRFLDWLTHPPAPGTPEVAGVAATSEPTAAPEPTLRGPTPTTQRTVPRKQVVATPERMIDPTFTSSSVTGPEADRSADSPSQTVANFYTRVSSGDFSGAAQLWSPAMRSRFPVDENITQRFSQTASIGLERADIIAESATAATVAVDVLEVDESGHSRRYSGAWYLVRAQDGWLLDEPQLHSAP